MKGIDKITIEDINFLKQLGYRIKLISECSIINNKIYSSTNLNLYQFHNQWPMQMVH